MRYHAAHRGPSALKKWAAGRSHRVFHVPNCCKRYETIKGIKTLVEQTCADGPCPSGWETVVVQQTTDCPFYVLPPSAEVMASAPRRKKWSWGQWSGWSTGGAAGAAGGAVLLNWWTLAAIPLCAAAGAVGGGIGGAAGHSLAHFFDAPRIAWTWRSAFLFSVFVSLALSLLFGLWRLALRPVKSSKETCLTV